MGEALFIGAGVKGAKTVDGKYQPYLSIGGKPCIHWVVKAALEASSVGSVHIWGNSVELSRILAPLTTGVDKPVVIVDERSNPVESFYYTYLNTFSRNGLDRKLDTWSGLREFDWEYLRQYGRDNGEIDRPVHILLSDTPLISAREIDHMIAMRRRDKAHLTLGRTTLEAMTEVLDVIPEKFNYSKAVKNYYRYFWNGREVNLILNSYFGGLPLKIDPDMIRIFSRVYENRTIIAGRKLDIGKLKNNYALLKRFLSAKTRGAMREKARRLRTTVFLLKSFLVVAKNLRYRKKFRDLNVIFPKIEEITGTRMTYEVSRCFGSAFDLDTPYEARFVDRNFERLREVLEGITLA